MKVTAKQMFQEVIKHYKKAPPNLNLKVDLVKEAELLAWKLKTDDRIEKLKIKDSFRATRVIFIVTGHVD